MHQPAPSLVSSSSPVPQIPPPTYPQPASAPWPDPPQASGLFGSWDDRYFEQRLVYLDQIMLIKWKILNPYYYWQAEDNQKPNNQENIGNHKG